MFDPGKDLPLSSSMLILKTTNTGVVAKFVTQQNGAYRFSSLSPATYTVNVSPPSGFMVSPLEIAALVRANDTIALDFPARMQPTATPTATASPWPTATPTATRAAFTLAGRIWADLNRNAAVEPDETGLAGVQVTLVTDQNHDGRISDTDPVIAQTVSDALGDYTLIDIPLGSYLLVAVAPRGHFVTTEAEVIVKATSPQQAIHVSFGMRAFWSHYLPTILQRGG